MAQQPRLPNLSGMPLQGAPTGHLVGAPIVLQSSANGLVGIVMDRTDGGHDRRYYLGTDDPHVQAVLEIARALVEKYKGQVVDGPDAPKYPRSLRSSPLASHRELAGKWKPLNPDGGGPGTRDFAERRVGSMEAQDMQAYFGTLTHRHGPADANGQIRTSNPEIEITAKARKPDGVYAPYSVAAVTLEGGSLRIVDFRAI